MSGDVLSISMFSIRNMTSNFVSAAPNLFALMMVRSCEPWAGSWRLKIKATPARKILPICRKECISVPSGARTMAAFKQRRLFRFDHAPARQSPRSRSKSSRTSCAIGRPASAHTCRAARFSKARPCWRHRGPQNRWLSSCGVKA
jgi:hypothetical protein